MAKLDWSRLFGRAPARHDLPTFCIVTPVFNGAEYIDETIASVLAQGGDFVLHYHVQDGGSTDDTLMRVRHWQKLAPRLKTCRELVFTCSSEPDTGMYDAINKGFARALPPGDDVVMGWIASDDRIAPGACATMLAIRAQHPDIRFMGGRISLLDHHGSILGIHPLVPFSRRCMAAGLYDGRQLSFIMQEGSFWCADVWHAVGGLDTSFRLAGDWDLWRRMAVHAEYVSVDSLLGFHRRRPGQLSEHIDRYYLEVDAALDAACTDPPSIIAPLDGQSREPKSMESLRDVYAHIAVEHAAMRRDPPRFRSSYHSGTAVRYNLDSRRWDRMSGFGASSDAPLPVTPAGPTEGYTVILKEGFRATEGPYPEFGLHTTIRWMIAPEGFGEVSLREDGRYRVVVRCRSWIKDQTVTILADDWPLGQLAVTPYEHDRDLELSAEGEIAAGTHNIRLMIEQPQPSDLYLLIIEWRLELLAAPDAYLV